MVSNANAQQHAVLHVRFAGRSLDIPLSTLDIGPVSDDGQVKRMVAGHMEVGVERFHDYVVDRHRNGNLTLRPEAIFG